MGRAGGRRRRKPFLSTPARKNCRTSFVIFSVADAGANALHQQMVIDMIEAALDVALDDPLVRPPLAAAPCSLQQLQLCWLGGIQLKRPNWGRFSSCYRFSEDIWILAVLALAFTRILAEAVTENNDDSVKFQLCLIR